MNKHILIMCITLLFALGTWGAYGVMSYKAHETITRIHLLKEESDILSRQNDMAYKAEHVFDQVRDTRSVLLEYIVRGDDGILRLIDTIENMGTSAGVEAELDDIDKVRETQKEEDISFLDVRVSTTGTWEDSITYGILLETYPWNIVLTDINLQFHAETGLWNGEYSFRLANVIF